MSSRNAGPGTDRAVIEGGAVGATDPTAVARTPGERSPSDTPTTRTKEELVLPKTPTTLSASEAPASNLESSGAVDAFQSADREIPVAVDPAELRLNSPTLDEIRHQFLEKFPALSDVVAAAASIRSLATILAESSTSSSIGQSNSPQPKQPLSQATTATLASLESLAIMAVQATITSVPQTIGSFLTGLVSTGLRKESQDTEAAPELNRTFVQNLKELYEHGSTMLQEVEANFSPEQLKRSANEIQALKKVVSETGVFLAQCEQNNEERVQLCLKNLNPATQQKEIERVCRVGEVCQREIASAREKLNELEADALEELSAPTKTKEEKLAVVATVVEGVQKIAEGEIVRMEEQPSLLEAAMGRENYRRVAEGINDIQRGALQAARAILSHVSALTEAWSEAIKSDWSRGSDLSDYLPVDYQGWSSNEAAQSKDFFGAPPGESLYAALMKERPTWASSDLVATENSETSDVPLIFQRLSTTLFGESIIEQPLHKSREDVYAERERRESRDAQLELKRRGEDDVPTALDGTISKADQLRAKTSPNR